MTMVMLHGLGGTVDNWLPIAKLLPKDQHMVIIELPGHGDSSYRGDDELSMKGMAERVQEFIDDDRSGLKHRRIHLIGAATGGTVAGYFAGRWTSYVDCLSLVCPAMRTPIDSDMNKAVFGGGKNPLDIKTVQDLKEAFNYLVTEPPKLSGMILRGILQIKKPYAAIMGKVMDKMREELYDGEEDVYIGKHASEIKSPTQVIWGEKDRIIHISGADVLEKKLPHLIQKHIIPKIGHSIYMQAPQTLTTMLVTFQQRFQEFV
ncbi:hypothetical protein CAPTEDRAFT_224198 [Capitella teleta]|uniref:acylglycerol lipase n=1 Tax=Capitella teleta TaxID=283909 RepID=R7UA73_CAPTE|nr:hypothetical protein CAPTEDRAFT_224198 [Capitella teleta]|eukprot:ELU00713.1 hypothetical protein CAPTEDRAFT_224198 [Capitella teleta]